MTTGEEVVRNWAVWLLFFGDSLSRWAWRKREIGMGLSGLCRGELDAQSNIQQSFFLDNSEEAEEHK